jgi:hypothetical protein
MQDAASTKMSNAAARVPHPFAYFAKGWGIARSATALAMPGEVLSLRVLSGPEMLKQAAQDFVTGWHVNRYGGPRECAIVIQFRLGKETQTPRTTITRIDPQHVLITTERRPPSIEYSVATK